MTRLVMVFSLTLCALFQAILPSWLQMGQAKAPLLLGGVLYYALSRDGFRVVEAAVLAGLLQDSLGPIPFGYSSLTYVVVALLANHFRDRLFSDSAITHMLVGFAAALLSTLILYVLLASGGLRLLSFGYVVSQGLGVAVLGLMVIPLVFKMIEWLDFRLGNVELKEI